MLKVLGRWPELRADVDANVEARQEFLAFRDRIATDDLPRFEREFKEQLNKNAIQELAGFNNWLHRQASVIDDRIDRINDAPGAVPGEGGHHQSGRCAVPCRLTEPDQRQPCSRR